MKYKKIIYTFLIMLILFNTLCPISFADIYQFGPGNSTKAVNWQALDGQYYGPSQYSDYSDYHDAVETIKIQVSQTGIYNVGNVMGGDVISNFVISANAAGDSLQPLKIATYGVNGESTMGNVNYNNKAQKTVNVYLEEGRTYYISFVSPELEPLEDDKPTESSSMNVTVTYIAPKEGEVPYETDVSSRTCSCPAFESNQLDTIKAYKNSGSAYTLMLKETYSTPNIEQITVRNEDLISSKRPIEVDANASWFEEQVTKLFLAVADGIRALIRLILNEDISIDMIVFNEYSSVRLAFFDSQRQTADDKNPYLEESGFLDSEIDGPGVVTRYFNLFRNIAIAVYIIILLYMGIRILLGSTGKEKDKYKSKLSDWVKGIIILVFFPYVMKYTIDVNNAIVSYIADLKENNPVFEMDVPTITEVPKGIDNLANSGTTSNGDIMAAMRIKAMRTGKIVYAIFYLFLLKQLITFIYIYLKRLISVTFLIVIFPLITISYAVDKIADGKSNAFNNWYKEYALNVFLQSFQAVNYLTIMGIIFSLTTGGGAVNTILIIIGIEFISKGEELLRSMFTKVTGAGAGTVSKSLQDAAKTVVTTKLVTNVAKKVTGVGKRVTNFTHTLGDVKNSYEDYQIARGTHAAEELRIAEENRLRSRSNPDNDAGANIAIALNASGTNSADDVKNALDNLGFLKNDGEFSADFNSAYGSLSATDQARLDDLMQRNTAINETITGSGMNGRILTREMNVNAKLITEIINGGSTGAYGDLYNYLDSHHMQNANGTQGRLLKDELQARVGRRRLGTRQQAQLNNAQTFLGNVTAIDASEYGETSPGTATYRDLGTRGISHSTRTEARSIQNKYGNRNGNQQSEEYQERASMLVARMKSFKMGMVHGTSQGCSLSEAMELTKEYRELSATGDADVKNILAQIGDESQRKADVARQRGVPQSSLTKADYRLEANVGFNMDQFAAMTASAVMMNKENLTGTREEITALVDDAGKIMAEVSSGRSADKVARAIVDRTDMDDFLVQARTKTHNGEEIHASEYIKRKKTQEQIRDEETFARRQQELQGFAERDAYDEVARAEGEFQRSLAKVPGAAASLWASKFEVALGVTSGAFGAGVSGDTKPQSVLAHMDMGMETERLIEKLVPGTQPSNSSQRSVGNMIDRNAQQANEAGARRSYRERNDRLAAEAQILYGSRARTNEYRNKLHRP